MEIKRCGGCHFGKIIPQDLTKRMCIGAPPTVIAIQTRQPGQVQTMMAHPVVSVSDDACALHRDKNAVDLKNDGDAMKAIQAMQHQPEASETKQ
jgi:hypothetical protein